MTRQKTNIGPERTAFFGRKQDIEALDTRLERYPLVTLLGSGGIGKTRLSRSYGAGSECYDEVWFCDLASARSEEDFVAIVADAIGIDMASSASARQLGHALALRDRILIILDNLEQAVATAAEVVGVWLDEAPNIRFLATSREPLNIRGECRYELQPLTPDAGLELFEARAQAVRADFELDETTVPLVSEVVARLDALPLAIELAASRVNVLPPEQLLERLEANLDILKRSTRDVSERHQTMRAAIEWSWQLLDEHEQRALCQASVFVGGFTLEAAEAVLPCGDDTPWPGDILETLVEKSLVRRVSAPGEAPRFDLFSTICEFAQGRLEPEDRQPAEMAHARYYTDLLAEIRGADFSREADNIEAAYQRFETREPQLAAEAALACYRVLRSRRVYRKIFDIVDRALAVNIDDPQLESKLLGARAISHEHLGRYAAALESIQRGLEVIEGIDAPKSAVFLQVTEATILRAMGEPSRALGPLQKACEAAADVEDAWLEAIVRGNLGVVAFELGDFERARKQLNETIAFARRHELTDIEAYGCCNAARYEWECGALEQAGELLARADRIRPDDHRKLELNYFNGLGHLALVRGEPDQARQYFQRALRGDRSIGDRHSRIPSLLGLSQLPKPDDGRAPDSYLREVLDIVADTDDSQTRIQALVQLAAQELQRGAYRQAHERLKSALSEAASFEHRRIAAIAYAWLGVAMAGLGAISDARAQLEHAFAELDGPMDEPLREDMAAFERLVELLAGGRAPRRTEISALVEEIERRCDARRFSPEGRIWMWCAYQHLHDLARVIKACAESLQAQNPTDHLRVSPDGERFAAPGTQAPVDLSTRTALSNILRRLAELRDETPGRGMSVDDVVSAGWPDDVVTEDAGASRVYTAIRTLRNQGLSEILITGQSGYMLDPDLPFSWL